MNFTTKTDPNKTVLINENKNKKKESSLSSQKNTIQKLVINTNTLKISIINFSNINIKVNNMLLPQMLILLTFPNLQQKPTPIISNQISLIK